jgi:hypothetical protein
MHSIDRGIHTNKRRKLAIAAIRKQLDAVRMDAERKADRASIAFCMAENREGIILLEESFDRLKMVIDLTSTLSFFEV